MTAFTQSIYVVELSLTEYADPTNTETVYLSNLPILISESSTEAGRACFPILLDIKGIGQSVADYMPKDTAANLVLDNSQGSFGYQRKFIDMLERYNIIEESISIYIAEFNSVDFYEMPKTIEDSDLTLLWEDKVKYLNVTNEKCQIYLKNSLIEDAVLNTKFNESGTLSDEFNNSGNALPIVLGENQQIKPVLYRYADNDSTTGNTQSNYYVASSFYNFEGFTESIFYCKDDRDEYVEVQSASQVYTAPIDNTSLSISSTVTMLPTKERGYLIPNDSSGDHNYILNSVSLYLGLNSGYTGTPNGTITVNIYCQDPDDENKPNPISIGSANLDKSNLLAGYVGEERFVFEAPVVMDNDKNYYFTISHSDSDATNLIDIRRVASSSTTRVIKELGQGNGWRAVASGFTEVFKAAFYCLTMKVYDANTWIGFNVQGSNFSTSSIDSYVGVCDNSKLDWIIEGDGIKDTSTGKITGTAYQTLTTPIDFIKFALSRHNKKAGTWSYFDNYFDSTLFSDSHSALTTTGTARTIGGVFQNETTKYNFISNICRNSLCKLSGGMKNSKLGLYVVGNQVDPTVYIYDKDCNATQFQIKGKTTIVNNVSIAYGKKAAITDIDTIISTGEFRNFSGIVNLNYDDDGEGEYITSDSFDIFGGRINANDSYPLISDEGSAYNIAKLIIEQSNRAAEYFKIEVPFSKYQDLQLFDVVSINSIYLPAFFGAAINPGKYIWIDGATYKEASIVDGHTPVRAGHYRGQIYDMQLNLSPQKPASITLLLRLLVHENDPT